jgi:hypothetical protein
VSEYDADILIWSQHQAALLRRLAAGEQVNEQIDWENVVEEIESVGRSEVKARGDAADDFTESMRPKINLALIYRRALRAMPARVDGQPPLPVPHECAVTLDEVLAANETARLDAPGGAARDGRAGRLVLLPLMPVAGPGKAAGVRALEEAA